MFLVVLQLFTLKGRSFTLSINFTTPIRLSPSTRYGLALLSFHSNNRILNIKNGLKNYLLQKKGNKVIEIPEGS